MVRRRSLEHRGARLVSSRDGNARGMPVSAQEKIEPVNFDAENGCQSDLTFGTFLVAEHVWSRGPGRGRAETRDLR